MLKRHRILSVDDVLFQESWDCYEHTFPEEERRPLDCHVSALADPQFYMEHVSDDTGFVAIFFYWVGAQYIYGEHLAIVPACRGQGVGSRLLRDVLQGFTQPFVLEIEPLVDELTHARYRFYQALGFHLQPEPHVQLPYWEGAKDLPLLLLTYPGVLPSAQVQGFQAWLQGHVARYNQAAQA